MKYNFRKIFNLVNRPVVSILLIWLINLSTLSAFSSGICEGGNAKCLNNSNVFPGCTSSEMRLCTQRDNGSAPLCIDPSTKKISVARCGNLDSSTIPYCENKQYKCQNGGIVECEDKADIKKCPNKDGSTPLCLNLGLGRIRGAFCESAIHECKPGSFEFKTKDGGCKHLNSGVVFSKLNPNSVLYQNAASYCNGLVEGGFDDWLLPDQVDFLKPYTDLAKDYLNFDTSFHLWTNAANNTFQFTTGNTGFKTDAQHLTCVRKALPESSTEMHRCKVEDDEFKTEAGGCKKMIPRMVYGNASRKTFPNLWSAYTYCNDLVEAGFDDWKLPSLNNINGIFGEKAQTYFNFDTHKYFWVDAPKDSGLDVAYRFSDGAKIADSTQKPVVCWRYDSGIVSSSSSSSGASSSSSSSGSGVPPTHQCKKQDHLFKTQDGGCKNLPTSIVFNKPNGGLFTWDDANSYCNNLIDNGYDDWRLPTVFNFDTANRDHAKDYFDFNTNTYFWTSEKDIHGLALGYNLSLNVNQLNLDNSLKQAVCVRGQISSSGFAPEPVCEVIDLYTRNLKCTSSGFLPKCSAGVKFAKCGLNNVPKCCPYKDSDLSYCEEGVRCVPNNLIDQGYRSNDDQLSSCYPELISHDLSKYLDDSPDAFNGDYISTSGYRSSIEFTLTDPNANFYPINIALKTRNFNGSITSSLILNNQVYAEQTITRADTDNIWKDTYIIATANFPPNDSDLWRSAKLKLVINGSVEISNIKLTEPGKSDFIVPNGGGPISGCWKYVVIPQCLNSSQLISLSSSAQNDYHLTHLSAVNFDNDIQDELVEGFTHNTAAINDVQIQISNVENGVKQKIRNVDLDCGEILFVKSADINNDGVEEIFYSCKNNYNSVAGPVQYGFIKNESSLPWVTGFTYDANHKKLFCNLDGDNVIDLLSIEQDLAGNIKLNSLKKDSFGIHKSLYSLSLDIIPSFEVIADFNKDGKDDVAIADFDSIYVYYNDGNGLFSNENRSILGLGQRLGSLQAKDLNNDGYADLIFSGFVNSEYGAINILLNNKNKTFKTFFKINNEWNFSLVDLNNDSIADILSSTPAGGYAYYGRGDGTFQTICHFHSGVEGNIQDVGRFSDDDIEDFLWVDGTSGMYKAKLLINMP